MPTPVGCVSLTDSIPLAGTFKLAFADEWQTPGRAFRRTGGTRQRWKFRLRSHGPLRVTIAYSDFFARGVQNNLNLLVDVPNEPKDRVGNENLTVLGKLPDPTNNVEVVKIPHAPPGEYFVGVTASNILHDGQHYALVVAGDLLDDQLTPVS